LTIAFEEKMLAAVTVSEVTSKLKAKMFIIVVCVFLFLLVFEMELCFFSEPILCWVSLLTASRCIWTSESDVAMLNFF